MAFLIPHLWEMLFGKRGEQRQRRLTGGRRPKRLCTAKPRLECLEGRVLLSTYVYTNAANPIDHLASNPANWDIWDAANTRWARAVQRRVRRTTCGSQPAPAP